MALAPYDSDGDGVPDISDNYPCVDNPQEADGDADGIGDKCDDDLINPGPWPDTDGDTWPDHGRDNCPCEWNPDQKDVNPPDGIGDACQPSGPLCETATVEWIIYGNASSGRIATVRPTNVLRPLGSFTAVSQPEEYFTRRLAEKFYELNDHLGDVRVVASDVKQPVEHNSK